MFIKYWTEHLQKFTLVNNAHDLFKWFTVLIFN